MLMKINELVGKFKDVDFLVVSSKIKPSSNGSEFIELDLTDGKSNIMAKKWDVSTNRFPKGSVVLISGEMSEWKKTTSILISSIQPSTLKPEDLYRRAPNSVGDLLGTLYSTLNELPDSEMKTVTVSLINRYRKQFIEVPAAIKMHHNYREGLLQHTAEVVSMAKSLLKSRVTLTEDLFDESLVVCGANLHDIGKCLCYKIKDGVPEMTNLGKFKDHLVVGSQMLNEEAHLLGIDVNQRWFMMLDHIIVSHHGKLEWGSPVAPCFPEAELVFMADLDSSHLTMMRETLDVQKETWSDKRDFRFNSYLYNESVHEECD